MFNIEWNDSIVVGIPSIDEDHKRLVGMLNELFGACFAAQGPEVLKDIMDRLVDYTHYHFDREIALLAQAGYPGLAEHKAEHARLVQQVQKILDDLRAGASHDLSNDTLKFLRHWLTDHIQAEDKEFGALLREKKVG